MKSPFAVGYPTLVDDRGAGTLLAFITFPILVIAVAMVWAFVDVSTVRQQAAGAADLAALAGSPYALTQPEQACVRAAAIARENRATMVSCTIEGIDIVVGVEIYSRGIGARMAQWLGVTLPPIQGSARAGPG